MALLLFVVGLFAIAILNQTLFSVIVEMFL